MTDPFDDLTALRAKAEKSMDPGVVEQHGDELWNAALAVLGFPPEAPVAKGDKPGHTFHGNQWVKNGSVRGLRISDQDLIDAEHGNVTDKAVGWSFVHRKSDGSLHPVILNVEPRFNARSMASEYGVRHYGFGTTVASSERLGREDEFTKGDTPGHDFHGNQWTGGIGGTLKVKDSDFPSGHIPAEYLAKNPRYYWVPAPEKIAELQTMMKGAQGVIRMTPGQLVKAVKANEVQNFFQSGGSNANMVELGANDYYTGRRIDMEHEQLGMAKDASPSARPVYGYLTGPNMKPADNRPESFSPHGDQTAALSFLGQWVPDYSKDTFTPADVIANPTNFSVVTKSWVDDHPESETFVARTSDVEARLGQMYNRQYADGATMGADKEWRHAVVYPCANPDGSLNTDVIAGAATADLNMSAYGTARVVMKDSVLSGSTITLGDSLDNWVPPAIPTDMAVSGDPRTPLGPQTFRNGDGIAANVSGYVELQMYKHAGVPYDLTDATSAPLKSYAVKAADWYASRKAAS